MKLRLSTVLVVTFVRFSNAFAPPTTITKNCHSRIPTRLPFKAFERDEDREAEHKMVASKPRIISLNSPEEFNHFVGEDEKRLCVIKFHASWCKSCKLFGKQYDRIGKEIGELVAINDVSTVTRKGEIRLAEIEYGKNAQLCKSLGVKKVPSIFFYFNGKKLDGFPCGPKRIAHTLERLNHYRSLSSIQLDFEADMGQGNVLGNDLLEQYLSSDSDNNEETSLQAEQSNVSNQ